MGSNTQHLLAFIGSFIYTHVCLLSHEWIWGNQLTSNISCSEGRGKEINK